MTLGLLDIALIVVFLSLPAVSFLLIGRTRIVPWLGFFVMLAASVSLALVLSLIPRLNPALPGLLAEQVEKAMVIGAVNGLILGSFAAGHSYLLRWNPTAGIATFRRATFFRTGMLCLVPWIWFTCVLTFPSDGKAFAKLKIGMSRGQVERSLGPPTGRPSEEEGFRRFGLTFWDVWGDGTDFGERDYFSSYWSCHPGGLIRVDYKGERLWRARWITNRGEQGRLQ